MEGWLKDGCLELRPVATAGCSPRCNLRALARLLYMGKDGYGFG